MNEVASRTLSLACLIGALRRRLADERGFTIIEVLVSAIVVAMAAVGTLIAFDGATKASGNNKAKTVAAGLGQAEQERVRAKTPLQLAALTDTSDTTTKSVNGRTYTLVSSAAWTTDPSGTTSCAGMGNEAGYQRITTTVTWQGQGAARPVTLDSLKAVSNGGYKDSRGSLAVKILDRTGTGGVSGVPVTITGPRSYSATTDANGCVLLGFVPVGTYTVAFSKAGYVRDVLPNAQAFSKSVSVASEQTASVQVAYDLATSLGVSFITRTVPGATSGDSATTGDGFTVNNIGLGAPNRLSFGLLSTQATTAATGAGGAAVAVGSAQKVLFPFTTYTAWAGTCAQAEPTQYGAPLNPVVSFPTPGAAVTGAQVREPTMGIAVKTSSSGTVSGSVVIKPVTAGCTARVPATGVRSFTNSATINTSLPYGDYTVCAQDTTSASAKRVIATVQNRSVNGTTPTTPASNTIKLPASASSGIPPCS